MFYKKKGKIHMPAKIYRFYLIQKEPNSRELELKRNVLIKTDRPNVYEFEDCKFGDDVVIKKSSIGRIVEGYLYLTEDNFELAKECFAQNYKKQIEEKKKEIRDINKLIVEIEDSLFQLESVDFNNKSKLLPGAEVMSRDCKAVILDQTDEDEYYVLTENGCVEHWNQADFSITGKVFHNIPYQNESADEQERN